MIIFRKYGKKIEITETERDPSGNRKVSSTRKKGLPLNVRRIDSARRTRKLCVWKLFSAIEELGSPLLITLTFKGSASDILYSSSCLTKFQRRLQIQFKHSASLFVPELSPAWERKKNGRRYFHGLRIHYHGLLFGVSQDWGDRKEGKRTVFYGRERSERVFRGLWGVGFVDLRQTDGSPRLAYYLSKYINKSTAEPFLTPVRLIRSSKNFPKEITVRGLLAEELNNRLKKNNKPVYYCDMNTAFLGKISKTFYDSSY